MMAKPSLKNWQIRSRNLIKIRYLGRRIPRSEFAKRISSIEKGYLQRVVLDKFFDAVFFNKTGSIHGRLGTYSLSSRI